MNSSPPNHSDWLELCRRVVAAQRPVFAEHHGIAGRTVYEGVGMGGDRTLVIDRLSEDAVFAELESLQAKAGIDLVAISEERGEIVFGDAGAVTHVVIDPLDGSLNARRTIPTFALSIAVAAGPSMSDVEFGYLYDFGSDEEFVAAAGGGATLAGGAVETPPGAGLEVVSIETTSPELVAPIATALQGSVFRFRAPGSLALSLAYVGAGRFDGMVGARPCRSVDVAAAQLFAREAGAIVDFGGPLGQVPLALDARYPVLAAREEADLEPLRRAQATVI